MTEGDWIPVGPETPTGVWLQTRREGEKGTNICSLRRGDGFDEWVEMGRYGRTTVTHSTFLPPTHWRRL